jgi:hypothetical protein
MSDLWVRKPTPREQVANGAPMWSYYEVEPSEVANLAGREVSDDEVDAIAEAVFDLEANPQRWSTTTESMRAIYRTSIRKALEKVRTTDKSGETK